MQNKTIPEYFWVLDLFLESPWSFQEIRIGGSTIKVLVNGASPSKNRSESGIAC